MAKTLSISDMIREEIRAAIRAEFGVSGEPERTVNRASVADVADAAVDSGMRLPMRSIKRTRRGGPVTAYVVANPVVGDWLRPNDAACYRAMVGKNGRNRQPMTENEVIAAIGRKDASAKKAAQSSIWMLRNHDADGNRLDLDNPKEARKAIVRNVRPE